MKKNVIILLAASGFAMLGVGHYVSNGIPVNLAEPKQAVVLKEETEIIPEPLEEMEPHLETIEEEIVLPKKEKLKIEKRSETKEMTDQIPFEVKYVYDDNLDKGIEKVTQSGKNGHITYRITYNYENDVLVNESKEEISRVNPTHKMVVIGTKEISDGGYFDDALAKQIFNLSNKALTQQNPNKKPPMWSNELKQPANIRAKEIVKSFSHTRPNGSEWYTVSSLVYAENLAVGYQTAQEVVDAWMESPGHKANIMNGYDTMSISVYIDKDGVMYVAQLFG